MKTFLINLDKDTDRLRAADTQLRRLGISYERFPAVYGRGLNEGQLSKHIAKFRVLMAHGMMWSPGQIGCTLSHLFLYKQMMDNDIKVATIFEDDVKFSDDFPKALKKVEACIDPLRRQVVLFSDHRDNIKQRLANSAENVDIIRIHGDICSEAYAITLPAAKEILRINYPMVVMVDAWTRYCRRNHIELFRVEPPFAMQNRTDFNSNLEMPLPYSTLCGKITWRFWRIVGRVLDEVLFRLTGK